MLLYNILRDGKPGKIKICGVGQAYEVGGLKLLDDNFFFSAMRISWLKHILRDNGKLQTSEKPCAH